MTRATLTAPLEARVIAASLVMLLHIAALLLLLRAFAPGVVAQVTGDTMTAITIVTPAPSPTPSPKAPDEAGTSGEAGRKAVPKPRTAPSPHIDLSRRREPAPRATSTGSAVTSGAQSAGSGTGAGGTGSGTGSGTGGSGQGGGGATPLAKIAGDISASRDYPRAGRDLRNGDHVVIELTVGTDGKARACRVVRASRDPQADQITCRLAMQRFRFRPRTDASATPVEALYRWQQRWWDPRDKN